MHDAMPRPGHRAGRFAATLLASVLMAPAAWAAEGRPGQPTSLLPEMGVRPATSATFPRPAERQAEPLPPAAAPFPLPTDGSIIRPLFYRQGGPLGGGLTGRIISPVDAAP